MLNIKSIISQISEDDYNRILKLLKDNKGEKFSFLFSCLKEEIYTEEEIMSKLQVNSNTYYTLKSRLFSKIQDFLSDSHLSIKNSLFERVVSIPDIIYKSPRNLSITILKKLEKDLIANDMPGELTNVYSALKKLSFNSSKYYNYEQLYNRHIAYALAMEKAEDILANFNKMLGNYMLSKDKSTLDLLWVLKKEMNNLTHLYESHRLKVLASILNISFGLFVPLQEATLNDEPIEDQLEFIEKIIDSHPQDSKYCYLNIVVSFLWFEYYHRSALLKKEAQYYEIVNANIPLLLNYSFTCCGSIFLMSKLERHIALNDLNTFYDSNNELFKNYLPDKDDVPNYINYVKYFAAASFYSKKYDEASALLNNLLNEFVFKNIQHSEIEIKLFLSLSYAIQGKFENAQTILNSVLRKVREISNRNEYKNAHAFIKLLSVQIGGSNNKNKESKMLILRDRFINLNKSDKKMLEFIDLGDDSIRKLSKVLES